MALIDQLEAKQNRKREVGARFTKASLEALTTAPSPQESTAAWTRVQSTWPTLLDSADKVGDFRATILDLALGGAMSAPSVENETCRLGDVIESMQNGLYKPSKHRSDTGTAYVRMYNIQDGRLDLTNLQRLSVTDDEREQYQLVPGDILVNRVNSRELVGKAALVREFPEPMVYEAMNIRLRCKTDRATPEYVNMALRAPSVRLQLIGEAKQAVSQASISQANIVSVVFQMPPALAEQKRIVAKIEHLMKLCDALEAALRRSEDRAAKLAEAVVQEMVA
jgi:type I restriction enzyme S subunit